MISRWYEYKKDAILLRKDGNSIRDIEKQLEIPRSTLSGWFKDIELTDIQRQKLHKSWLEKLSVGRKNAVLWHNKQKHNRILQAKMDADYVLNNIDLKNKYILELALSMLYLGEGSKKERTSIGNTNPLILKFFLKSLFILYGVDKSNLKCELHLRGDQNENELKKYWSNELGIPMVNFSHVFDKRPLKSETYLSYKGVCVIECGRIAILRRLSFLNEGFCGKILEYQGD